MSGSEKPRLLVTTSTLPCRDDDGEPRFVLDLSAALQDRFDVTILAPAQAGVPLRHELSGVPIVRYRYAPLRRMETLAYPGAITSRLKKKPWLWPLVPGLVAGLQRAITRLVDGGAFDCVHCHWAIPQGYVQSRLAARGLSPPFVLTLHGGDVYTARGGAKRRMIGQALESATAVTVVSQALKRHLVQESDWPVDGDAVSVIPMGCDLGSFSAARRDDSLAGELGLGRPVMLFVGRLAEKKGLHVLLQAMARPEVAATGAGLMIAGDGPLRGDLEQQVRDLGLGQRVRFLGSVPHSELPRFYASADLFCAPFVIAPDGDSEGLPTVLSEAGVSGLACVVGDVGGVHEIVADGETGLIVPPGDTDALTRALAGILQDDARRRRMAATAVEMTKEFDWRHLGARYGDVIGGVLQRSSGTR